MIYLAQTDTTAGFLSKDYKEINRAKMRSEGKPCLITGLATIDGDQLFDYRHVIMLMRLPN